MRAAILAALPEVAGMVAAGWAVLVAGMILGVIVAGGRQ